MTTVQFVSIPNEAELLAISKLAQASHLNLITNGKRSMLCSIVPAGWRKMIVVEKTPTTKTAANSEVA